MHVADAGNAGSVYVNVQNSEGTVGLGTNAADLYLTAGGAVRLTVQDSGNVGIGTTSPSQKLDVAGIVNATGFYVNGLPFAGGGSQSTTSGSNIYLLVMSALARRVQMKNCIFIMVTY